MMTVTGSNATRSLTLNGLTVTAQIPITQGTVSNSSTPENLSESDFYHELEIYHKLLKGDCENDTSAPRETLPSTRVAECQNERTGEASSTNGTVGGEGSSLGVGNEADKGQKKKEDRNVGKVGRSKEKKRRPTRSYSMERIRQPETKEGKCKRRSRTLGEEMTRTHRNCLIVFNTSSRPAKYMGSFPVNGTDQAVKAELVTQKLHQMKESGRAIPVLIVVSLAGVKVCRPNDQSVQMAHALRRISYATCEPARTLFGFVAREPRGPAHLQYCHSFTTETAKQAEELNALVGNAFRMAFATQLHQPQPNGTPTHTHPWKELANNCNPEVTKMGIRAPNSIPGLRHHYPHNFQGSHSLKSTNLKGDIQDSTSPSSSEESNSPTELNSYKRIADKPPLMKRLALGISGALMLQAAHTEDSTPLVPDTPTSPLHKPISLNGGYVNEGISDLDLKAGMRDKNNSIVTEESLHKSSIPVKHIHIDNVNLNNASPRVDKTNNANFEVDLLKINNNKRNRIPRIPSSSSSSCGGNGSPPLLPLRSDTLTPKEEAELRLAPWFQAGIPREIALEVLGSQPVGAFMVRESTTKTGCFALSLRVPRDFQPSGIAHYLILHTNKGYKIKGFTKEFTSLTALITHHSVMPELLPCPLSLSRYNPSYSKTDSRRDFEDIDKDPDYNTLADFRRMMADLNV